MPIGLEVRYRLLLSDFNERWTLWTDFRKILKYQMTWKSFQLEPSCSVRTDGQTDNTELITAFYNFAKAPASWFSYSASGLATDVCILGYIDVLICVVLHLIYMSFQSLFDIHSPILPYCHLAVHFLLVHQVFRLCDVTVSSYLRNLYYFLIQGDQKVSALLMITV
jgi:hypothetical protein